MARSRYAEFCRADSLSPLNKSLFNRRTCTGRRKMSRSALIAGVAVIALVLWMLSGQIGSKENVDSTAATTGEEEKPAVKAMKVQTRLQHAESITREIVLQGQVEPLTVLTLRSEASGNVKQLHFRKGQRIGRGQILATLSIGTREADLAVARASLVQTSNEYRAALKLQKQGLQSQGNLESAAARREVARAQVQAAELAIEKISITAPIDALIEDLNIEEGDFIDVGTPVATLIDKSQILVTGRVPQQNRGDIKKGLSATAELITGQSIQGRVRYLSSMAENTSRSFEVEILVENPPLEIATGISAEISIPVETLKAHRVSPAILALDDEGALGVKSVNTSNTVTFHKIEVVKTESNGAWVTGLPDSVTLITMGQGFVNPGEQVDPVPEKQNSENKTENEAQHDTGLHNEPEMQKETGNTSATDDVTNDKVIGSADIGTTDRVRPVNSPSANVT